MSFGNSAEYFNQRYATGGLQEDGENIVFVNQSNGTTMPPEVYDRCNVSVATTTENILYALFISAIMLTSVFGNALVLTASIMIKQLRRRPTIYFICSLAVSDAIFAISAGPFIISMKFHQTFCHGLATCYWLIISDSLCNVASILSLFLIAIDRFIAIRMPFRYTFLLRRKRAIALTILVWVLSAIWCICGLFMWGESKALFSIVETPKMRICANNNKKFYAVSFLGIYLVPLSIMTVTYLFILLTALRQIKAIEATQIELQSAEPTPILSKKGCLESDIEQHKRATHRKRRKELKATKSVAIVYFAFLICWFPSLVINLIIRYNSTYFPKLRQTNKILFLIIYYTIVQILPMVNTMINPIIYSFSNKQFKKAFKALGNRVFGRNYNYPDSPNTITQKRTEDEKAKQSYTPETSISSQSFQSINNQPLWSPKHKLPPKLQNLKGVYANTSIESEMISTNSSNAIWKPD